MAKKRKNQPARPGVHAELSGNSIILKGNGVALRVPLSQPGPGPAKPQKIEALAEHEYLAALRLMALGIDDIDRVAKILRLDRTTARAAYEEARRAYNENAIESGLKSLFEQNHDFCERSDTFWPFALIHFRPSAQGRKNHAQYFKALPSAYRIKQFQKQGLTSQEIAKGMQYDEADFQRWLEDHASLLAQL